MSNIKEIKEQISSFNGGKTQKGSVKPHYTNQDKLRFHTERMYEHIDEMKKYIPWYRAIVSYGGKRYWAELCLCKNPLDYPDIEEYYWQSKFGLPNPSGLWYDLYELTRDGNRPSVNNGVYTDKKTGITTAKHRPIYNQAGLFSKAIDNVKPMIAAKRIEDLEVIRITAANPKYIG